MMGRWRKKMRTNLSFHITYAGAGRKYEGAGKNTLWLSIQPFTNMAQICFFIYKF